MKQVCILILFNLIAGSLHSQAPAVVCSFKCSNNDADLVASCYKPANGAIRKAPIESFNVNPYEEFDLVLTALRKDRSNPFPLQYTFKECDQVCNAASLIIDSIKYIYYNQHFLNTVGSSTEQLRWIVRCIIAHEIGHHLLDHTLISLDPSQYAARQRQELHADYFSAFVIKQFAGSSIDNALAGIRSLNTLDYHPANANEESSFPYPTLDNREKAIREGFFQDDAQPLRIAMFQRIDSVALATAKKFGSSIILHEVDRDISFNDLKGAARKIEMLKQLPLNTEERKIVDKADLIITGQTKKFDQHTIDPTPALKPEEIKVLEDLSEQLRKSKSATDRLKGETLLKSIKELKAKSISD